MKYFLNKITKYEFMILFAWLLIIGLALQQAILKNCVDEWEQELQSSKTDWGLK